MNPFVGDGAKQCGRTRGPCPTRETTQRRIRTMKPHHPMTRRGFARSLAALSLGAVAAGAMSGCNVIGAVAQFAPEPDIGSAYANLRGQTVAVMVWVDRGARIDYPSVQADVAHGLTNKPSQLTNPEA